MRPKSRRRSSGSFGNALAAIGALVFVGCGASTPTNGPASPVIIGADIGQSGFMNAYDVPVARAAQFAVDDINKAGGVLGHPLQIVTEDYHSKVEESGPVAQDLVSKGARLIITACDFDLGSPAALVAQNANVIADSCAGSVQYGVQGIGPLAYTYATAGRSEGAAMAEFAYKQKQLKTAWTLRDTTLTYYSETITGFTQRFSEFGGHLAGAATFKTGDPSISAQINQLRAIQPAPDVIFLGALPSGGSGAMRQLRAAGFQQPIMSSNTYDGDFWKQAIPDVSNVFFTTLGSLYGDDPSSAVNAFVQRYRQAFGATPDSSILVTGYAMVQAFKLAAEKANSFAGDKLARALDSYGTMSLLVGPTKFSSQLHIDLTRQQALMQVQGGKTTFLQYWQLSSPPKLT